MNTLPPGARQAGTDQERRDEEADGVSEEREPPCQSEQVPSGPRPDELLPSPFDRHEAPVCYPELVGAPSQHRDGCLHREGEGDIAGRQDDRDQVRHDQICRTEGHGDYKGHQGGARDQVATHHQPAPVHSVGNETGR